ncbi:hypothetical protein [Rhodococcus erythropolis]
MKTASLARLSAADAFLLDNACPDIVSVLVFDIDGESPSFDTIRDQIRRNIERMDALPVRLAHDRLKAGFPYRVRSHRRSDSAIVELRSSTTWEEALTELSDLAGCKVDPFTQCVKVHVFRNVESSPTVSGTATLVALQVNHAIVDGRGAARILQELLDGGGSSSVRARPLDRDPSWMHTAMAVVGVPGRLARTYWRLFRLPREAAHDSRDNRPEQSSHSRTGDGPSGIDTVMFDRQDLTPLEMTVTETALTAVAFALPLIEGRSYRGEVPIAAPPGLNPRTVNNLVNVVVELPDSTGTPSAAAFRIRELLTAEIETARNIAARARLSVIDGAPAFVVRAIAKNAASEHNTSSRDAVDRFKLTSYQAPVSGAHVGGTPPSFAMSIPTLGPSEALTVTFVGFGDVVTTTIAARPGPIDDLPAFLDRLVAAVADLGAADRQHRFRED